jgi:hypothetical protein
MWFLTGKVDDEPLRTLDDAAKTKSGFGAAFLLPDDRSTLEQRESLSQAHQESSDLQLLEADVRKHDKALTDVLVASVIFHRTSIEIACANLGCLMKSISTFVDTQITGNDVPFLQIAARRLALLISSSVFRRFQARNPDTLKNKLNYLAFSLLNKVMAAMAKSLRDEPSIMAASKMNVDGVNLASVKLAHKILQTGLENITNIVSGAETMEVCVLYTNSIFHERWLKKQQQVTINLEDYDDATSAAATGRRKSLTVEEDEEPAKKIPRKDKGNVGPLIYTGDGILPLPSFSDYPNGEIALCGAAARNGTRGCNKPNCKLDHNPPQKWSKGKKKLIIKLVKETDDMSWNMAVVDKKWLGSKASKASEN